MGDTDSCLEFFFCPMPGANCYKCRDLTPNPHFLSWNPVDHPILEFHRPQDFGVLYFG